MIISHNWLKEFVDFSSTPKEVEAILTMLGLEVERIDAPAERLQKFVVGKVLECAKHPNADKLSVCSVEVAPGAVNTIVCGAPNVAAGQVVPVALEGAVVPNGGFVIAKRKLRGTESNGMICSRAELGLEGDADGIWVLAAGAAAGDIQTGTPLADFLGLNDVLYEISITPNRADCLSHLGVARELAAYYNLPLRLPQPSLSENGEQTADLVSVRIEDAEVCWRFAARVVTGVRIGESPAWLKNRLAACGQRPINNVVDVTNYVMLECGKPIHAFDLDKVARKTLIVRRAERGEKFVTLDDKERILDEEITVVADAERSSAIGGVMGGQLSEIGDQTQNVCIESAVWKPSAIRRTGKKLGLTSEAAYRFERGVDPEVAVYAANRAAQLIAQIAGGSVASGVVDVVAVPQPPKMVAVRYARANVLIGKPIDAAEQRSLLERLGCVVTSFDETSMTISAPTFRVDIATETDLIEEIARLYGYDNIEARMTARVNFQMPEAPVELSPLPFVQELTDFLRANGFHELMTQNMIDPRSAALFTDNPVRLKNPLGEELSCLRPSLVPSILKVVERNARFGQKNLRLFELGTIFAHTKEDEKTFIAGFGERTQLIAALVGTMTERKHWSAGERAVDFYDIKGVLESLLERAGVRHYAARSSTTPPAALSSNCVEMRVGETLLGWAGEVSASALARFKIEMPVFLCALDLWVLPTVANKRRLYAPVSAYPAIERDVAFVVDVSTEAENVRAFIANEGGEYLRSVRVFDVFAGAALDSAYGAGKKSVAFALRYNSAEKTLADADVDASVERIVKSASERFGAVLRR